MTQLWSNIEHTNDEILDGLDDWLEDALGNPEKRWTLEPEEVTDDSVTARLTFGNGVTGRLRFLLYRGSGWGVTGSEIEWNLDENPAFTPELVNEDVRDEVNDSCRLLLDHAPYAAWRRRLDL